MLRVDLHVHSCYSSDSLITSRDMVFYAGKAGLNGVAITDHDTVDGALRIAKETDLTVVPGIEISSLKGHIIGLNISESIPPKLSVGETLDRIHDAGGIAVACHPTTLFKESLRKFASSRFDAIEVINSSAFPFKHGVKRGREIALKLGIASVGGSDAHYGPEVGCAYTLIESNGGVEEIVEAVKRGSCSPHGTAIPLATRLKREFLLVKRKIWPQTEGESVTGSSPFGKG